MTSKTKKTSSELNKITNVSKKTTTSKRRSRSPAKTLANLPFDKFIDKYVNEIAAYAKSHAPEYKNVIIAQAINSEPDTLFTAKHFSDKLKCSSTRVYNILREMASNNEITMVQTPKKRVYYTSIHNKNIAV